MNPTRVLVIEDNASSALDLSNCLQDLGYHVCGSADNGTEALALVESEQPDIVLMGIVLNEPIDGVDAAARIAQLFHIPVVLLTTAGAAAATQRSTRTAPHGYLIQPFQPRELRAAIEVALYKATLERRLHESERWFTTSLCCVVDGVVVVDLDSQIRFLNPAAERILGITLEEALGRAVDTVLHFEDTQILAVAEVLRTDTALGIYFGKWLRNTHGERVPVDHSAAPIRDDDARLIGAVAVIRDVSERFAAEEALRSSEERFRTAFDFAPEGMALVTMDGRFIHGNAALCRLLQCSEAELQQLNIRDVTPPQDHAAENLQLARMLMADTPSIQFEQNLRPRHGNGVRVLTSVSLLIRDECPFCYLYQLHDLSARKQMEDMAKKQEQLSDIHQRTLHAKEVAETASQAKTVFIANMSHELRTPLNAILGFAQLLDSSTGAPLTPDQREFVQYIQRAGWHLLDLISEVLDLGRVESGALHLSMEPVNLNELIAECVQLVSTKAVESGIALEVGIDLNFSVTADRIRLRQVMLNLLSNAIKYNSEAGTVFITCTRPGRRVRIAVRDTGPGLSADQQKHLFEPFNRLGKESGLIEGNGIGLVITKRLIEAMDGSIGVDSELDAGSVFWIELQGERGAASAKEAITAELEATATTVMPTRPCTILCVEDNPVNLVLVSRILQAQAEWKLLCATTGEKGYALALENSPDLILLDISLPDISGLELIKRLRMNRTTRAIPVVAVSANAGPQYIQEAMVAGFNRYITKPIHVPEFLQTVRSLLSGSA
jgi:PAS domain S-box-containing protein